MNAVITSDVPGASLVPANLSEAVRFAEVMAQGRLVPKHLQGSPGDCLMVIEQAARWRMSPFAVAQAISVITGKMMFEGKLVAAAVETSGAIVGHLDYTFDGEGENRSITVSATRRSETNPRTVTVTLKEARTNNEMWKRQPDQQLCYHGARVWARRWTPAVILGVYSREEMGPVIEGEVVSDEREAINAEVKLKAAAADMPRSERIVDKAQVYDTKPRTPREFLDALAIALHDAQDAEEADRILCRDDVLKAKETFTGAAKTLLDGLIIDSLRKWTPAEEPDPTDEELGEVEIEGAEKAGA